MKYYASAFIFTIGKHILYKKFFFEHFMHLLLLLLLTCALCTILDIRLGLKGVGLKRCSFHFSQAT